MTQSNSERSGAQGADQELNDLKKQLQMLEKKYAEIMKKYNANSDYRNDLIWMSQDINKINSRIKELEKQ